MKLKPSFILRLDRRIIYVAIALAVTVPLLLHFAVSLKPTPIVQNLFDTVEALPPGSKVLLSFDYGPSTLPENDPMAFSFIRHLLTRGDKIYMMALMATGARNLDHAIEVVIDKEFPQKVYGVDYVDLGYKAGDEGLINTLFKDFKGMYTTDVHGTSVDDIPMMRDIQTLKSFDMILNVGSGRPGTKEWIQYAGDRGNIPIGGGVTAVEALLLYPYYPRQLKGLMGGLQGAAEYETALISKYPQFAKTAREAQVYMGPQAVAHYVIILLVILGNISYFVARKGK
jgi:hypothetical protein